MPRVVESTIEQAARRRLAELQYPVASGPELAPGKAGAEPFGFCAAAVVGRRWDGIGDEAVFGYSGPDGAA